MHGACHLIELRLARAQLTCGLVVAIELILPHLRYRLRQLVANAQQFHRAQARMDVVEVQTERLEVPLQCFLESGSAQPCLARFLTCFLPETFAPSRLDIVASQRKRPRTFALIGLGRSNDALNRLTRPSKVAKALIDGRQPLIGLDIIRS